MRLIHLVFFCAFANLSFGQSYRFNTYTVENGIPQNFIYSINQDKNGYLFWSRTAVLKWKKENEKARKTAQK